MSREWKPGDVVQVRDRRDNGMAIARGIVIAGDAALVVVREYGTSFQASVPHICVEHVGQQVRNPK